VRAEIVRLAHAHDAIILTDEVYEHLVFDGVRHVPIATEPGAWERTLTVSSAGKTFSVTGWKIGWISGPASLVDAVLTVKQFLSYVNGSPFQPAIATALRLPDAYFDSIGRVLAGKRDLLVAGLQAAGMTVSVAQGTYFTVADAAAVGAEDALILGHIPRRPALRCEFCVEQLPVGPERGADEAHAIDNDDLARRQHVHAADFDVLEAIEALAEIVMIARHEHDRPLSSTTNTKQLTDRVQRSVAEIAGDDHDVVPRNARRRPGIVIAVQIGDDPDLHSPPSDT